MFFFYIYLDNNLKSKQLVGYISDDLFKFHYSTPVLKR